MDDGRTELLREIRDAVINLIDSPLYDFRVQNNYFPVLGQGDHYARIMFIGEAPGANEAKKGRPFCGAAGRILDELLASIDLPRESVYITNVLKDRPPENRDPLPEEIEIYAPFLYQQISIIQPEVIVTLGRFATEFMLRVLKLPQRSRRISQLHGKVIPARTQYGDIVVVPMYHPAIALYKEEYRDTLFEDFQVLRQFVE